MFKILFKILLDRALHEPTSILLLTVMFLTLSQFLICFEDGISTVAFEVVDDLLITVVLMVCLDT